MTEAGECWGQWPSAGGSLGWGCGAGVWVRDGQGPWCGGEEARALEEALLGREPPKSKKPGGHSCGLRFSPAKGLRPRSKGEAQGTVPAWDPPPSLRSI